MQKQTFATILSVLAAVFLVITAVHAVTTIGNNVSVGGSFTASGAGIGTTTPIRAVEIFNASSPQLRLSQGNNRFLDITASTTGDILIRNNVGKILQTDNTNYNTYFGVLTGENDSGTYNVGFGGNTLSSNTTGEQNTGLGGGTLSLNTEGNYNTAVGSYSMYYHTTGDSNVAIGRQSLVNNTIGNYNVVIGDEAGTDNVEGDGNIFLGFQAGCNETGSNKLYINNGCSVAPLIKGDFDTGVLLINSKLGVGSSTVAPLGNFQVLVAASTTAYIGSATFSGCLVLGDSDKGGLTYITALNGVLTATTTKPSICQ